MSQPHPERATPPLRGGIIGYADPRSASEDHEPSDVDDDDSRRMQQAHREIVRERGAPRRNAA